MNDRISPGDEQRLLALLEEARSAPLPSASLPNDAFREERRSAQVLRLGQLIQKVPSELAVRRALLRRLGVGLGAVAVAAALLLWLGIAEQSPSSVAVASSETARTLVLKQVVGKVVATHRDGSDVVLSAGMGLQDGDHLSTTAEAFASLELEAGIRVDLASATTLKVVSVRDIELRVGRVDVNVPKLPGAAPRLSVETPDARVIVRGTIFSVEVDAAGPGSKTQVGVTRGAVSVIHQGRERLVGAGELWSSEKPLEKSVLLATDPVSGNADREPSASESPVTSDDSMKTPRVRGNKDGVTEPASEPEAPSSSLGRQNAIFERGLRARDQGDDRRAVYWFDQLLRRYPGSPLAESAERERAAGRSRLNGD